MQIIPISLGRNILIDDDDFIRVKNHRWHLKGKGPSIGTKIGNKNVSLASFIMRNYSQLYDHKDRNFLNIIKKKI